jgi:hypothetical protein
VSGAAGKDSKSGKECFVISPSTIEPAQTVLDWVIKPAVERQQYVLKTPDKLNDPGDTLLTWVRNLLDAPLVVANLADNDPGVHYGVAVRHTTSKPVIIVVPAGLTVPDYMAGMSTVSVNTANPKSVADAIDRIRYQINVFETEPAAALENPVVRVFANRERIKFEDASNQLKDQIDELNNASVRLGQAFDQLRQIADATRKPLRGIAQIMVACYDLLFRAPQNSRIWFVGMTLGLGPPHRYRNRQDETTIGSIEADLKRVRPDLPTFDEFLNNMHNKLIEVIQQAPESTIVCLDQSLLSSVFLERLARRHSYQALAHNIGRICGEIRAAHEEVEQKSKNKIRYLTSLPLQLLIVDSPEWAPGAARSRVALVFHVGSENVASAVMDDDGELGFYTEVDSLVSMFANLAESLYTTTGGEMMPVTLPTPRG